MKWILTLTICGVLSIAAFGEDNPVLDSLNEVLNSEIHDTTKVLALLDVANQYYLTDPDTALIICLEAEKIAEEIDYTLGRSDVYGWLGLLYQLQADSERALEYNKKSLRMCEKAKDQAKIETLLANIGFIYLKIGNLDESLDYFDKSLKLSEELANSSDPKIARSGKESLGYALNNLGTAFSYKGDIKKSLEYHHKSLRIREEQGDQKAVATSLNNIGMLYEDQGDIEKALEFMQKCLSIRTELKGTSAIATALNNIGSLYASQGEIDTAMHYLHKSMALLEELGDKYVLSSSLNNIGTIYRNNGNIPKGLEYLKRGLKIKEEIGDKWGAVIGLNNISSVYAERGDLKQAKQLSNKAMIMAEELGSPMLLSAVSNALFGIAKMEGNYEEALIMYELHIQMRDSIKNEETQKASIRQQTKYEFEKAQLVKEQEEREAGRLLAEKTSRRDNLQYSVILISLLVIGGLLTVIGRFSIPLQLAEGLIFFSFLIFFEFILVLADPYIENWSGGAPGIKLLFNAGIAALIFPLHSLFETKLKKRLA